MYTFSREWGYNGCLTAQLARPIVSVIRDARNMPRFDNYSNLVI